MGVQSHLWIEDKKGNASFIFWETFMRELFPWIKVESKQNNSELVKAVKNISDSDRYYILIDNSFDNPNVYREQSRLRMYSKGKNVVRIDLISFEYTLLEFAKLLDWVYAEEDELKEKRKLAINARNTLIRIIASGDLSYKRVAEIEQYDADLSKRNIEQLASKLLFDLTRNTGFEVTKRKIGYCWIGSCCTWSDRQDDDICGLDSSRLSTLEKMKSVFEETSLKSEFSKAGHWRRHYDSDFQK